MLQILHVIPRLSNAGPTRTLLFVTQYLAQINPSIVHSIISLDKNIHPFVTLRVKRAGVNIIKPKDLEATKKEIYKADIVQIHFWNNPLMYEFLLSDLPPMRLLFWFKILGYHAPQVITEDLVNCSDYCLVSSPASLDLPCFQNVNNQDNKVSFALSPADLSRLKNIRSQNHEGFNVGYIGTANFTKIHPQFIQMSCNVDRNNLKFIVCGGNDRDLKQVADEQGVSDRFEFHGYVDKICEVLETIDVFGYPLSPDNYATSEQALQEAMYAQIPPVVFNYGGMNSLVKHQETGLLVNSESEYTQAIEFLYDNPELRLKLGKQAQEYAQEHFQPHKTAQTMVDVYERLMSQPKNIYQGLSDNIDQPCEGFASSLGEKGEPFWQSLQGKNLDIAHQKIAQASNVATFAEGGIFQYRNSYPTDPYLRLWTGLILQHQGRVEQAQKEFQNAIDLGLDNSLIN